MLEKDLAQVCYQIYRQNHYQFLKVRKQRQLITMPCHENSSLVLDNWG